MMSRSPIKRILVPVDMSGYVEAATYRACLLARANQATVTGIGAVDTHAMVERGLPARPDLMIDGSWGAHAKEYPVGAEVYALHEEMERFSYRCEKAHVAYDEVEVEGPPVERILEAAPYYDLLVTGLRNRFSSDSILFGFELGGGLPVCRELVSRIADASFGGFEPMPAAPFSSTDRIRWQRESASCLACFLSDPVARARGSHGDYGASGYGSSGSLFRTSGGLSPQSWVGRCFDGGCRPGYQAGHR